MNYNVTCYYNTGFNGINIPEGPELLNMTSDDSVTPENPQGYVFERKHFDSLDILQDRFLSSVDIRAEWKDVRDVDYIRLLHGSQGDSDFTRWYYFVTSVTMLNVDTARLYVTPDYLTSTGGVKNLEIIDGITERVKITETDAGLEFFEESDPLTAPANPLGIVTVSLYDSGTQSQVIVESTVDVGILGSEYYTADKVYGTTSEGSTLAVSVPKLPTCQDKQTAYSIDGETRNSFNRRGTALFAVSGENETSVQGGINPLGHALNIEGIANLRSLGSENVITRQFVYDMDFIEFTYERTGKGAMSPSTSTTDESYYYSNVNGRKRALNALPLDYDGTPSAFNKRVYYGSFLKIGIISSNGDVFECNPEEAERYVELEDGSHAAGFAVCAFADPRPDGCPYFYIPTKTNPSSEKVGFRKIMNSIKGMEWKTLPLVFTEKSGNALDRMRFDASQEFLADNYGLQKQGNALQKKGIQNAYNQGRRNNETAYAQADIGAKTQFASSMAGVARDVAVGVATGNAGAGIGAGAGDALSAGFNYGMSQQLAENSFHNAQKALMENTSLAYEQAGIADAQALNAYEQAKFNESLEFAISQNVVQPTVMFPYNSEFARDFYGNGVLAYKYVYTGNDAQRINKILNAYGVKVTLQLEQKFFTGEGIQRNTHFSYVKCSAVSVTGHSNWLNNAISAQLVNGVRVWHDVKPSSSYYEGVQ